MVNSNEAMCANLTPAVEDYLKAIYALTKNQGRASTNQLAEQLGVAPASVTGMLQKLAAAQPPLVVYQKHRGVALTPAGARAALEVIRHHRLLELFLQEKLGYAWDEVHEEADRLEHVISEDLEERIAQALGDPVCDPHGELIPTRDLQVSSGSDIRLSELRPDQAGAVERVDASNPGLLRYLSEIGLIPQAQFIVMGYSSFDGNLTLEIQGKEDRLVLGPAITRQVFVLRRDSEKSAL